MHVYFLGIGGTGVGPLALIAKQAGYEVSGSDKNASQYTKYLIDKDIDVYIDDSGAVISEIHASKPIDWVIAVSAIVRNRPDHPDFIFAREHNIQIAERDALLNQILRDKKLQMIAAAGTHGKTTTTAMLVWLLLKSGQKISYSLGAKTDFADMGHYEPGSQYFVYECDEFHRNFLQFHPYLSAITGVTWDHHEVFPTREDYKAAFREFLDQSENAILWQEDANYLQLEPTLKQQIIADRDPVAEGVMLPGLYNRRDAWLAVRAVAQITGQSLAELTEIINRFPGSERRMQPLAKNLYTDYAHTPEKILACLDVARDIKTPEQKLVVIYEPLTNRRQHFVKEMYADVFVGIDHLYWLPSYLAREDPEQPILTPEQLIGYLSNQDIAAVAELDDHLSQHIRNHLAANDLVVAISGGGGGSLDEWLRGRLAV